MKIDMVSKTLCTGCQACQVICPYNAIEFIQNEEGFWGPRIDQSLCIECGKCYKICPTNLNNQRNVAEKSYVIQSKNHKASKKSASGGAFVGIANFILDNFDGVVVGASQCEDLVVRHIVIEGREDICRLQNSKYVQSYVGESYLQVKHLLQAGRTVFFTGTPCQVAGLYAILTEQECANLYTADIVCHGVPSPAFLKRQLDNDSMSKQGKVIEYRFRFKNPFAKSKSSYFMFLRMERGLPMVRRTIQEPYFDLFMKGMNFRESCYSCKYADLHRVGDFTFGDCDSYEFYPDFHPNESNSVLLLNTEKAVELWNKGVKDDFDFCDLDLNREAEYNHQLKHPMKRPSERDEIYKELLNTEWKNIQEKYAVPQSKLERYKLLLLLHVPRNIIERVSRLKKRLWKK